MKVTDNMLKRIINEEILRLQIEEPTGEITEKLIDNSEKSQEYKTSLAIESFRRLYRQLDPDTRYFFTKWLKQALIKDLTVDEAISLTSKISAASKGNAEPKQPNKK